jgi:hypothetical protein
MAKTIKTPTMSLVYTAVCMIAALAAPALAKDVDPTNHILNVNIGTGGTAVISPGTNQELGAGTLDLFFGEDPPAYGTVSFHVWTNGTFQTPCVFSPSIGDQGAFWPLGSQLGWFAGSPGGTDVLYYRAAEIAPGAHLSVSFSCVPKQRNANH